MSCLFYFKIVTFRITLGAYTSIWYGVKLSYINVYPH